MTAETLRTFFLYCTLINVGLMLFTGMVMGIAPVRKTVCRMQAKMFGMRESEASSLIIHWLGNYKTLSIVFNLVP